MSEIKSDAMVCWDRAQSDITWNELPKRDRLIFVSNIQAQNIDQKVIPTAPMRQGYQKGQSMLLLSMRTTRTLESLDSIDMAYTLREDNHPSLRAPAPTTGPITSYIGFHSVLTSDQSNSLSTQMIRKCSQNSPTTDWPSLSQDRN